MVSASEEDIIFTSLLNLFYSESNEIQRGNESALRGAELRRELRLAAGTRDH